MHLLTKIITEAITNSMMLEEQNNVPYQALLESFQREERTLQLVEKTFSQLTAKWHDANSLKYFFQSWSKLNNSAMSISGLANRVTLVAKDQSSRKKQFSLLQICANLQRITDEDLGANGGSLHSDLFYKMATRICGDDLWLSKTFCLKSAYKFKQWTDQQRLREKLINGLLVTLIHEIYTHGELEYIYPLCKTWVLNYMHCTPKQAQEVLSWIFVHIGGPEINHFEHAAQSIELFSNVMDVRISKEIAQPIFDEYLQRRAIVMEECSNLFLKYH